MPAGAINLELSKWTWQKGALKISIIFKAESQSEQLWTLLLVKYLKN